MVVSDNTKEIIKNFYGINQGVVFRKGEKQTTISQDERMLAEVVLDIDIPTEIGIYDLSKFLGNLNSLESAQIEFGDNVIRLSDKDTEIAYYGCKPSLVFHPDEDLNLTLDQVSMQFKLPAATLSKVLKIAAINASDQIVFSRLDDKLYILVKNSKDDTATSGKILLQDDSGESMSLAFDVDVISKLLPATYTVKLNTEDASLGVFEADGIDLKYYISSST